MNACDRQVSAVGIAMATRKMLHENAIKIFAATEYAAALAPGLLLYCELNGLPLD